MQEFHCHKQKHLWHLHLLQRFVQTLLPLRNSLWLRTNKRNVGFGNSLRWPIYIVNSIDKTNLSCNTPGFLQKLTPLNNIVVRENAALQQRAWTGFFICVFQYRSYVVQTDVCEFKRSGYRYESCPKHRFGGLQFACNFVRHEMKPDEHHTFSLLLRYF